MSALGKRRYTPSKLLIFFTLKRANGQLEVVNRHMRGVIWLAWKALWQQLEAIHAHGGQFDQTAALTLVFGMHHAAVLAALRDYKMVSQLKASGGRKYCSKDQEVGETYRVWPFVSIELGSGAMRYTAAYHTLLNRYGIKPAVEIEKPMDA